MNTSTNENKDCIILLEDEQYYIDSFINLFEDLNINLRLIPCLDTETYELELKKAKENHTLKCIIMDLSNTQSEEYSKEYKASEYIKKEFDENRIPIFIHSSKLQYYSELQDKGTVFKVHKSPTATTEICKKIKEMEDSDFFNIFCINGKLEKKIMSEIHNSFIEQFKDNEISDIIKSIKSVEGVDVKARTIEVFERMAIRAVYENWISSKFYDGKINEIKLNSIEHYYRRTSSFDIWTGDIFKNEKLKEFVVVLTPRCNLGHNNTGELLVCRIKPITTDVINEFSNPRIDSKTTKETKGRKSLRTSITDDVTNNRIGEVFRFLPPTPQFNGGFVDFRTMFTKENSLFLSDYERIISLSDELTNDIVRKFSSYIQRGGISETEFDEAHFYVSNNVNIVEP